MGIRLRFASCILGFKRRVTHLKITPEQRPRTVNCNMTGKTFHITARGNSFVSVGDSFGENSKTAELLDLPLPN